MNRVEASTLINATPEVVFAFHLDPKNLIQVLPPYLKIEIVEAPSKLSQGARLVCVMLVGPLRFDWQIEISKYQPPHRFSDIQTKGPFRKYEHTHLFSEEAGATRLSDVIEYELPLSLADLASRVGFVDRLKDVLAHGQQATRASVEKHHPPA
jgi:hypothetical protein